LFSVLHGTHTVVYISFDITQRPRHLCYFCNFTDTWRDFNAISPISTSPSTNCQGLYKYNFPI